MQWRPDFARNLADGWMADGTVEPHDERSTVRAAGSMDTTIDDLPRGRRCVLLLANDVRAEPAFPHLVRFVLGEAGVPWNWKYGDRAFWDGR
ncbi:hypothetical protein [Pyxidicoccus sp. MSG2]|uniref:hypothetical protein n=1 Tax=Pyxidicoccus sp. MSG2 TaxID=2996790 RepID=UPI00226D726D|nr:hypothetical protein [Pyxidicoccus sp. MSG2]MCY1017706.1 hypothetical protein [Pyxidicoccus sp. MSG2]